MRTRDCGCSPGRNAFCSGLAASPAICCEKGGRQREGRRHPGRNAAAGTVPSDSEVETRTEVCKHPNCAAVRQRVITFADGEAVSDIFYTDPDPLAYCPGAGCLQRGNA